MYYAVFICCTTALTCCHSLPFVVTYFHSLSLIFTLCHSLYHLLSLVVIRCHSLYHSLSLDVPLVCFFINDQKRTPILRNISHWLILPLASIFLELKVVGMCFKKKKMKFYKETWKKTLIILYKTRNN